jgi:glycosyltransferase involved in cell wall biosynthesis
VLRVVWIVPGFSSSEEDWCIPALLDLARALARRCELRIIAMRYPYRCDRYSIAGAMVYSMGGGHRGRRYTPGIWRDTARAVRDIRCDVLHAFWGYEPGLVAAWFSRRIPIVTSLAGGELVSMPEIDYGLMRQMRNRTLIRWALGRARVVTAGSPYLVAHAQAVLSLPAVRHMPLGVDLRRWPISSPKDAPPMILNVGALEPVKGQDILLQALQLVLREMPSVRCRIVGTGRARARLEASAQELRVAGSVEFVGEVPHPQMSAIYGAAKLFVQASWHEAQGMALLEAAAGGLPLAGTKVGAITNFIPDSAAGAPVGDAFQLARAMLRILSHSENAEELGRMARAKVEEIYDIETVTENFLQLYQTML